MNNYERYNSMTKTKYYRKGISHYLMGIPAWRFFEPYLTALHGEDILDVGIGYGNYNDTYYRDNHITGYDINPQLGKRLGIEIIKGNAADIGNLNKRYDRIVSFAMTEYLDRNQLEAFVNGAIQCLKPGGVLGFSIIENKGIGIIYVTGAKLKGIEKYAYSIKSIREILGDRNYTVSYIRSIMNMHFMVWVELYNEGD